MTDPLAVAEIQDLDSEARRVAESLKTSIEEARDTGRLLVEVVEIEPRP
ncbi:hypothetical protein [Actinomadura opuntiae]|nr:hypothetical protein [Actinomadura sp. OS1-43]MDL4813165.1 hypothetical protein [Actinomadura sp. OS1-43]